jgi:cystine transport system substrate-binding protein
VTFLTKKLLTRRASLLALAAGSLAFGLRGKGFALAAEDLETLQPGKISVAFTGDMPGTSWEGGKLVGADGEMLQAIADRLHLTIVPAQMEWSAAIASVTGGRVDMMLGMMGWQDKRTKIMNLTDPLYYAGTRITQRKETNYHSLADLQGKRIAMMTGTQAVSEIQKVPGAEVKLYDTLEAAVKALIDKRVDLAFVDAQSVQYMTEKDPTIPLKLLSISDPYSAQYPNTTAKWNVIIGVRKEAPKLAAAISREIDVMWKNCENQKIAAKYGLGETFWFTPPEHNDRAGVDRPADWAQPVTQGCG